MNPKSKPKPSIAQWRLEIARQYNTRPEFVVSTNSMHDRDMTGRQELLAEVVSPYGGKYRVYGSSFELILKKLRRKMDYMRKMLGGE